jgi:transposase
MTAARSKDRKRHLLVDTQGTLLKAKVQSADIHDHAGAELLLSGLQHLFRAIKRMWADTAYRDLKDRLQKALGWTLTIPQPWWSGGAWTRSRRRGRATFRCSAAGWVLERTIAWLATSQRLPKDYERLVGSGEMLLYLAMSPLLLRRLTRKHER